MVDEHDFCKLINNKKNKLFGLRFVRVTLTLSTEDQNIGFNSEICDFSKVARFLLIRRVALLSFACPLYCLSGCYALRFIALISIFFGK